MRDRDMKRLLGQLDKLTPLQRAKVQTALEHPAALSEVLGLIDANLLAELQGVLSREKFSKQLTRRGLTVADVFDGYAALVGIVTPAIIVPTISRDPADDQVLAAALAAQADLIVSGDSHLLDLKRFHSIQIVTAAIAAARIESAQ